MVIPQYDYLKQLSVSHESYHSDDYLPETAYVFPSVCWTHQHDFNFILSILSIVIQLL